LQSRGSIEKVKKGRIAIGLVLIEWGFG